MGHSCRVPRGWVSFQTPTRSTKQTQSWSRFDQPLMAPREEELEFVRDGAVFLWTRPRNPSWMQHHGLDKNGTWTHGTFVFKERNAPPFRMVLREIIDRLRLETYRNFRLASPGDVSKSSPRFV